MNHCRAEADRSCFVFFVDASNRHQEVAGSAGGADELQKAHHSQEDEKLLLAINSARSRRSWSFRRFTWSPWECCKRRFFISFSDAWTLVKWLRWVRFRGDHATGVTCGNVREAIGAAYRRISHKVAMTIGIACRRLRLMSNAQRLVALRTSHECIRNHPSDAANATNHVPHREKSRRWFEPWDKKSAEENANAWEDDRQCSGVETRSRCRLMINRLN